MYYSNSTILSKLSYIDPRLLENNIYTMEIFTAMPKPFVHFPNPQSAGLELLVWSLPIWNKSSNSRSLDVYPPPPSSKDLLSRLWSNGPDPNIDALCVCPKVETFCEFRNIVESNSVSGTRCFPTASARTISPSGLSPIVVT